MGKIKAAHFMPHAPILLSKIGGTKSLMASNTLANIFKSVDEIKNLNPDVVIILSPHKADYTGINAGIMVNGMEVLEGDLKEFSENPLKVKWENNMDLAGQITAAAFRNEIPCICLNREKLSLYEFGHDLDYGTVVTLHFLEEQNIKCKIVSLNCMYLPREELYRFGMLLSEVVVESEYSAVVIASGDLAHSHPDSNATFFDDAVMQSIFTENIERFYSMEKDMIEKADQCGLPVLDVLFGILDGREVILKNVSYEKPFDVGYGIAQFELGSEDKRRKKYDQIMGLKKTRMAQIRLGESEIVSLARRAVEGIVRTGHMTELPNTSGTYLFSESGGVFVTLKKDGLVRGCMGTTNATRSSLGEEVIGSAILAAAGDSRYEKVSKEELPFIEYFVDCLSTPEKVYKEEDLDVIKYGILVFVDGRIGVVLPSLPEVKTVRQQIDLALQKAAIGKHEKYNLHRFLVNRFK